MQQRRRRKGVLGLLRKRRKRKHLGWKLWDEERQRSP